MWERVQRHAGVMRPLLGDISAYDRERDATAAGQGAGAVHDVLPAGEIVRQVIEEAEETIERLAAIAAGNYRPSPRQERLGRG